MDKILIAGIDCVAAIGVTPEERTIKQRLSIDEFDPLGALFQEVVRVEVPHCVVA